MPLILYLRCWLLGNMPQVVDVEERKRLMRQFAAEREAAKARILQVGNQLLTQTKPASAGGASVRTMGSAAGAGNSP
jgi:UDP-N-acetylglucosamine enolpyruvyl transferase